MRKPTRVLAAVAAAATLLSPVAAAASDLGAPAAADSTPAAAESGQVVYIGAGQTLSLVRYNRSSYRRTPHLRLLEAPSAPVSLRVRIPVTGQSRTFRSVGGSLEAGRSFRSNAGVRFTVTNQQNRGVFVRLKVGWTR